MRRLDILIGVGAFLLGAFVLVQALRLDFVQRSGIPGPGFLPVLICIAIVALGIGLAANRLWRPAGDFEDFKMPSRAELGRSLLVWLIFLGSILLMGRIGFLASSILLVGALLLGVERLRSPGAGLTVLLLPLVSYLVFVHLLKVALPTGPWGF